MIDEKFLKYSEVLDVGYVYEDAAADTSLYEKTFKSVQKLSYDEFINSDELLDLDIVFINFSSKDLKTLFLKVSKLTAYTVIFTPYESNASFLKNALKFKVDTVTKDDLTDQQLKALFEAIIKNISVTYKQKTELKRLDTIINATSHAFLYIVNNQVVYLNKMVKDIFDVSCVEEFEQKYIKDGKQTDLLEMILSNDTQRYIKIKDMQNDPTFLAISKKVDQATVLSLTPIDEVAVSHSDNSIINRIRFIEELKNEIIHKDKSQVCSVNLVFIKVTNMDAIIKEFGTYNSLIFTNEFAKYIKESLDKDALITTWNQDGFVLMSENVMYDHLKESLNEVSQNLQYEVFQHNIVPFTKCAIIQIKTDNLNEIISTVDSFFSARVDLELAKKYEYCEINQVQDKPDSKDGIINYFSNIMYAQTPLKLLNVYKGVNITTTAYVEKINKNNIIVKAKNIQLYTMQIEKHTVVQSPSLPKDVEVSVDLVDLKKNVAIFSNPKLLDFSANNRETTRVQSDFRFPIKMKQGKTVHSGEILDLSIKSVAIKFPAAVHKQFAQGMVEVSFRVPVETHDDGFFQTQIPGKFIRFDKMKEEKFIKAIVLLEIEEPDEAYVLEYIYKRQKEIIFEIKKLALKGLANGF